MVFRIVFIVKWTQYILLTKDTWRWSLEQVWLYYEPNEYFFIMNEFGTVFRNNGFIVFWKLK